jgi:hypothetical protein
MSAGRRYLLGGIAAAAVSPALLLAVPNPDAALLEACATYMRAERAWNENHTRLCDAEEAGRQEEAERLEALGHAFAREQDEPLALIIETPARTNAGRRAKAEAVRTRVQLNSDGAPMDPDEALLWSLCDDLAAAAGEA